jgi:hypothetical protein
VQPEMPNPAWPILARPVPTSFGANSGARTRASQRRVPLQLEPVIEPHAVVATACTRRLPVLDTVSTSRPNPNSGCQRHRQAQR